MTSSSCGPRPGHFFGRKSSRFGALLRCLADKALLTPCLLRTHILYSFIMFPRDYRKLEPLFLNHFRLFIVVDIFSLSLKVPEHIFLIVLGYFELFAYSSDLHFFVPVLSAAWFLSFKTKPMCQHWYPSPVRSTKSKASPHHVSQVTFPRKPVILSARVFGCEHTF